jgi:uncharacterized protein YndB with AHSA1/START domain
MPEITYTLSINAPTKKVQEALTQQHHLALWWTPQCEANDKKISFHFEPYGDYVNVKVIEQSPTKVEWMCTNSKMLGTPDWINTTITFNIKKAPEGTTLHFSHKGWKEKTTCFKRCTDGWDHFLKSLKAYLETGKGAPFTGQ